MPQQRKIADGVKQVFAPELSKTEEGLYKSCQHIHENIACLDWL